MPRILVLADCDSELGDRPIVLEQRIGARTLDDPEATVAVLERVGSALRQAEEVEQRVTALYAA
jgi:hypothetical protein